MMRLWLAGTGGPSDRDYMTSGGRSAALRERVASGEYVVDPHAVAEAMLSRMFVAAQPFCRDAVRPGHDDAGTALDGPEPRHG